MSARDAPHPKIGAGSFSAWLRQGLREIRSALYPESNVAQPAELGMYGTQTPGEIAEARREEPVDLHEERPSILSEHVMQAEAAAERQGREPPEPEPEKE